MYQFQDEIDSHWYFDEENDDLKKILNSILNQPIENFNYDEQFPHIRVSPSAISSLTNIIEIFHKLGTQIDKKCLAKSLKPDICNLFPHLEADIYKKYAEASTLHQQFNYFDLYYYLPNSKSKQIDLVQLFDNPFSSAAFKYEFGKTSFCTQKAKESESGYGDEHDCRHWGCPFDFSYEGIKIMEDRLKIITKLGKENMNSVLEHYEKAGPNVLKSLPFYKILKNESICEDHGVFFKEKCKYCGTPKQLDSEKCQQRVKFTKLLKMMVNIEEIPGVGFIRDFLFDKVPETAVIENFFDMIENESENKSKPVEILEDYEEKVDKWEKSIKKVENFKPIVKQNTDKDLIQNLKRKRAKKESHGFKELARAKKYLESEKISLPSEIDTDDPDLIGHLPNFEEITSTKEKKKWFKQKRRTKKMLYNEKILRRL